MARRFVLGVRLCRVRGVIGLDEKLNHDGGSGLPRRKLRPSPPEVSSPRPVSHAISRVQSLAGERLFAGLPRLPGRPKAQSKRCRDRLRRIVHSFPLIRSVTAAGLTLIAMILSDSAGLFQPVQGARYAATEESGGVGDGGLALAGGAVLSKRKLKHIRPSEKPLSAGRINLVLLIPRFADCWSSALK